MTMKKRNATESTRRNDRASKKRDDVLKARIKRLEQKVRAHRWYATEAIEHLWLTVDQLVMWQRRQDEKRKKR